MSAQDQAHLLFGLGVGLIGLGSALSFLTPGNTARSRFLRRYIGPFFGALLGIPICVLGLLGSMLIDAP